jgi:hypothetical protein
MVVVRITESGTDNSIGIVERVSTNAMNMDLAWRKIHLLLLSIEQKQFAYSGRRGPNPWPALSPNTIARKRRLGLRLKKMHATEELANSLRTYTDPLHVWRVWPAGEVKAEFGSRAKAFAPQQFNETQAHFPFRPPVDLTENDVNRVTKIIHDHVMSGAASRQAALLSGGQKAARFRASGSLTEVVE